MKGFSRKNLARLLTLVLTLGNVAQSQASDFSLPFVNVSDLGTSYAGWAAVVEDASTAFTNPAGLTCLEKAQIVFPLIGLFGYTKFTGDVRTPTFPSPVTYFESGSAASKLEALMPSFYFSVPLTKRLTFALFQTAPFGLGTEYDNDSIVRYIATKSKVAVVDFGPSLGFKVTDQLSVGAGFDAQYLMFTLNHEFGPPFSIPSDSENKNAGKGWGYGWHAGLLYQFLPCVRFGFNYLSRVWFHSKGYSTIYVPWLPPEPEVFRSRMWSDSALPERAQASIYVDVTPRFAVMSTLYYTHWQIFNKLILRHTIFFDGLTSDIEIPFNYHDALDVSVGMHYKATNHLLLRTGFQIMGSPVNNRFRAIADPIGPAIVVAVGARFQQNCHLSYDIGYGHSFFYPQPVQLVTPLTSVFGTNKSQSNLLGIQINYTM